MARAQFPLTIAAKHRVLFSQPLPPGDLVLLGDKYAERNLWHDALDFYDGAQHQDRLKEVLKEAIKSADLVLYLTACKALGKTHDPRELASLKEKALAAGKEAAARRVDLLLVKA